MIIPTFRDKDQAAVIRYDPFMLNLSLVLHCSKFEVLRRTRSVNVVHFIKAVISGCQIIVL